MKNIWMLALANLRKNKGQAVSVLAVILLATMLLSIGLVVLTDTGRFFDERATYLHAPHFLAVEEQNATNNDRLEFIEGFAGVVETETQEVISGLGGYFVDDALNAGAIIIADGSVDKEMNPLSLIGDYLPLVGDAIYIPHFMFLSGYELGDSFQLDFLGGSLDFTVAGSTEDVVFGDQGPGNWRVYVPHERFLELTEEFPNNQFTLLLARLEDASDATFLLADYSTTFSGMEYAVHTLEGAPFPWMLEMARGARIMMPSMVAVLLTAFSLIILIVGIIVIRFRIVSSIEEGMVNIGALKAMGYRNRQIIASIVLQFGSLALVGSILGMFLSYLIIPLFAQILEPLLGLVWIPAISALGSFIAITTLMLLVILFSFASASRIRRLHPLVALRGGISTHNFRKNSAALDTTNGSLVLLLAMKQLLQNKKQAFTTGLIIAGLMFAAAMGLAIHYNMNVNTDAFMSTLSGEMPDVIIMVSEEEGQDAAMRISERAEVEALYGGETTMLFIDDVLIRATVMEDFSHLTGDNLIEGRFPQHDNEITLGTSALRVTDKDIGDWATIRIGNMEQEFLITGVTQSIDQGGLIAMMGVEGMRQLQPDFSFSEYHAELVERADVNDFIEAIIEAEGDALMNVFSIQDQLDTMFDALGGVFALITFVILMVAVAVIVLVLYMIIKTTIRRRRRELGIQKALGFTTFQLMNQISLSLLPIILFGSITGALVSYFGFNPLLLALMRDAGVIQADMPSPVAWFAIASVVIIVLAYAVSMLIAWRIRKISAYALVTE